MSKLTTEKYLIRALLKNGAMSKTLFEEELQDQIDEFMKSKREDGDDYFFALTERDNQVAMILIDEEDALHINEDARTALKGFWQKTIYDDNILMFLPQMVDEINQGYYFVAGVKVADAEYDEDDEEEGEETE